MQKKGVYLDNAAATPICERAYEAFASASALFGNPSSIHAKGYEAECILNDAREEVAQSMNAKAEEIVFTPGGTFGNNLAILGTMRHLGGAHIITSLAEHSAVYNTVKHLEESMGYKTTYIKPTKDGGVDIKDISKALRPETALVSIMLVNNETGTINKVDEIKKALDEKKSKALLHTDAVQGYTKIKTDVHALGVDLLTITSHKIHGHRGIGALYVKKNTKIHPITFGGGQEQGLVPGTQSPALAASFAAAVKEANVHDFNKTAALARMAQKRILDEVPRVTMISSMSDSGIFMLSLPGLRGETIVHYLAAKGIFISAGSACGRGKRSRVANALELDKEVSEGAVRISFSRYNTAYEVDALIEGLKGAQREIAGRSN